MNLDDGLIPVSSNWRSAWVQEVRQPLRSFRGIGRARRDGRRRRTRADEHAIPGFAPGTAEKRHCHRNRYDGPGVVSGGTVRASATAVPVIGSYAIQYAQTGLSLS